MATSTRQKSTNVRADEHPQLPLALDALRVLASCSPRTAGWLSSFAFIRPRRFERPKWEKEVLADASPWALRNGSRAWTWGGSGPWVLLVHGWEGRGAQLGSFVRPFRQAGLSVVAFDARGHGDSPGHQATLLDWLEPISELRRSLGEPAAVVAHSFGCPAVTLALRHGLEPGALVYIAPPDALDLGTYSFSTLLGLGEPGLAALRERLQRLTHLSFEDQRIATIGRQMRTPLLVVHDEGDRDVSFACAATYARHWEGCRVVVTRGLGHRRILRAREVLDLATCYVGDVLSSLPSLQRWLVSEEGRRPSPLGFN